jgi:hypothetical protein
MLSVRGRAPTPFAFEDEVPKASQDGTPEDGAIEDGASDSASEDKVPEDDAPEESAMEGGASEDSASGDDTPEYYTWEECGPADDTEDDNTPQPQHKGKEVNVVDPPKKITYIDLTGDAENCAHCADILGKGDDFAAHTFWFQTCGCVRFQSSPTTPSEIITFY